MSDNIGLPGNPYNPREARRFSGCAAIGDRVITDGDLIGHHLGRLTHAVMALAYEQRTANLIATQIAISRSLGGWAFTTPSELNERLGKDTE